MTSSSSVLMPSLAFIVSMVSLLTEFSKEQTVSLFDGRNGWTRKVPVKNPMLMKKCKAPIKGLLLSGPRVKTSTILSAVRNSPYPRNYTIVLC